jgi:hypothetical protein
MLAWKKRIVLVIFFAAGCAQALAQGGIPNLIRGVGELTKKADPEGLAAKPMSELSRAACSAGNAVLGGIAEQNPEAIQRALTSAKERYDYSYKLIMQAADSGAFKTPIDKKALGNWKRYTDADLNNVETREDLLRQIAMIVKNSTAAMERIESGKSNKDDLALIIKNSAEITRLIAAFYDLTSV